MIAAKDEDSGNFKIPRASANIMGLLALSLFPTGGAIYGGTSISAMSVKLDSVIESQHRFEAELASLKGANTEGHVQSLDSRLRGVEESIAALRAAVGRDK